MKSSAYHQFLLHLRKDTLVSISGLARRKASLFREEQSSRGAYPCRSTVQRTHRVHLIRLSVQVLGTGTRILVHRGGVTSTRPNGPRDSPNTTASLSLVTNVAEPLGPPGRTGTPPNPPSYSHFKVLRLERSSAFLSTTRLTLTYGDFREEPATRILKWTSPALRPLQVLQPWCPLHSREPSNAKRRSAVNARNFRNRLPS